MAAIQPFAAIRYNPAASGGDLSARIAPPYDVLDQAGKNALLARDSANFVKVDLPHMPPKHAGPPAAYDEAARQIQAWLRDGTLVRDGKPALYVYHQLYRVAGVDYLRKMFFARLRLEEFGQGGVFPHEQTFGGPKADRLALTVATRANLSPIFGLYEDAGNAVAKRLEAGLAPAPLLRGSLEEVESRVWAVTDAAVIADVTRLMQSKPVFIADGHHRYGTSLNYRTKLRESGANLAEDHPANFVLCVLCAMEDPGLLILPTHRVLPGVRVDPQTLARETNLAVTPLSARTADEIPAALAAHGPQAVGLWSAATNGYVAITPRDPRLLDSIDREHSPAWRGLGLAFLHAYLIDRVVTPALCAGKAPEIHYVKSAGAAVDEASATGGAVFLMQPTTMDEMRAVCKAGDLMPQKSTFFFPKLASGLVIHSLAD